jgi:hypothetical protein
LAQHGASPAEESFDAFSCSSDDLCNFVDWVSFDVSQKNYLPVMLRKRLNGAGEIYLQLWLRTVRITGMILQVHHIDGLAEGSLSEPPAFSANHSKQPRRNR